MSSGIKSIVSIRKAFAIVFLFVILYILKYIYTLRSCSQSCSFIAQYDGQLHVTSADSTTDRQTTTAVQKLTQATTMTTVLTTTATVATTTSPSNIKNILAYTTLYGLPFQRSSLVGSTTPLTQCKYKCTWSTNKADINNSDAVIFHMYNLSPEFEGDGHREFVISDLPKRRDIHQKWMLMLREPSAFFYPQQLKLLNNTFNLTASYMSDSDVHVPYGHTWKLSAADAAKQKGSKDYMSGREKMVFALVSNCITSSRRENYIQQLQNYTQVDVLGLCGKPIGYATWDDKLMQLKFPKDYKFYLAFENADCDDYVTEKFWNSLLAEIIPVVRGRRVNYQKLAPPNSYIHADDFETPQHLADYLSEVASNSTLYNSYHDWRKSYGVSCPFITSHNDWLCDICEQVHVSPQKAADIYEEFSEDTRCYTYDEYRNRTGERVEDIEQ